LLPPSCSARVSPWGQYCVRASILNKNMFSFHSVFSRKSELVSNLCPGDKKAQICDQHKIKARWVKVVHVSGAATSQGQRLLTMPVYQHKNVSGPGSNQSKTTGLLQSIALLNRAYCVTVLCSS
jgi:hypothetical protein